MRACLGYSPAPAIAGFLNLIEESFGQKETIDRGQFAILSVVRAANLDQHETQRNQSRNQLGEQGSVGSVSTN